MTRDVTVPRLLSRHVRAGVGTSVLIGVLVALTVFAVALAPRALLRLGTDELTYELKALPKQRIDLTGAANLFIGGAGRSADEILESTGATISGLPAGLPAPLSDGAGEARWVLRSSSLDAHFAKTPLVVLRVRLAIDPSSADRVRYVQGTAPGSWVAPLKGQPAVPVQIALSKASATEMGLTVGDVVDGQKESFLVSGIYEPVDDVDPFWTHAGDLRGATVVREPGDPLRIESSALIDPESLLPLAEEFGAGGVEAWVPIDPTAYHYSDLATLGEQVRAATASPVGLPDGELTFRSSLDDVLRATGAKVAAMSALIALGVSGFVGVLVASYALCIRALVRRRRTGLALAIARGASPTQARLPTVIEAALISLPGAALAMAFAAVVLPESVGIDGWLAPVLIALVPVALAAVLVNGRSLREGRDDLSAGRASGHWVVEVATVSLAVVAVYLLQRRGLVASSAAVGIDPLLSATPLLLAAVVGLVVIRLYPLPLYAVHHAVRRRIAATASAGSARAIRDPAIGVIAILALVTGISTVVFTAVMISTVSGGLEQSARDRVGADVQVQAHNLPDSLVEQLAAIPGVGSAVAIVSKSGIAFSDEAGPSEVTVVLADTAALHAVRPDIPDLSGKVDGKLPIVVSSDWASRIDGTELHVANSLATVRGEIDEAALPGASRHWLLADIAARAELGLDGQVADLVLASLAPGADPSAVVRTVTETVVGSQPDGYTDTVIVDSAVGVLATLRQAPVISGLERSLLIVAFGTLALTMLVVALSSITAAASRNRVVGVLRIIGMSRRQIRSMVAWEFAPVAIGAIVVGGALGVALPYLVTSVLDLRDFFGGLAVPRPVIEPAWIAAAIAVIGLAFILAAVIATAAGRRLAPAGVLKMGEE